MKKIIAISIILFFAIPASNAQEKQICITVDDLPTVLYYIAENNFKLALTKGFIKQFTLNNIPAIGFVNENKLYRNTKPDPSAIDLVELWLKSGLELGNHTYSHVNYHRVSFEEYTNDIIKGEVIIRGLANKYHRELKYFRHPYLMSGKTKQGADSLRNFLVKQNYTEAPVTIDNEDYLFAKPYEKAFLKDDILEMTSIGTAYLEFTKEKLAYYENISLNIFHRHIPQIFLIHANKLNLDYLDELLKLFKENDYSFVSLSKVLEDKAYSTSINKFGDWGISWLERWAMSKGNAGYLFKLDPPIPAFIKN